MLSNVGAFQMQNNLVKLDYWNFTSSFKFSKSKDWWKGNSQTMLPSDKRTHAFVNEYSKWRKNNNLWKNVER